MSLNKGMIVLMGSGELTSTMVEVHKQILGTPRDGGKAVFLDTPAGFQLNCDQLSQRAVEYFHVNVQHPLSVVSFKSKDVSPFDAEKAFRELRTADYILVGPGSPTYAIRQWLETPIHDILAGRIEQGGCLVAASAAALTVGRFTLPVYEIYKVGEGLHWERGIDIFKYFGFNLVIIPHWNNAEGGNHDTRYCFMGEARFKTLVSLLPDDVGIMGLDEHTACIIDLEKEEAEIRGIGSISLRFGLAERTFRRGERFPLSVLRGSDADGSWKSAAPVQKPSQAASDGSENEFWNTIHVLEHSFHEGLNREPGDAANAVLELDRLLWKAQEDLESAEFISQGRELLREMIALLGTRIDTSPARSKDCRAPLVEALLTLRESFRINNQWKEADALRDCLKGVNIIIEDTAEGARWRVIS